MDISDLEKKKVKTNNFINSHFNHLAFRLSSES